MILAFPFSFSKILKKLITRTVFLKFKRMQVFCHSSHTKSMFFLPSSLYTFLSVFWMHVHIFWAKASPGSTPSWTWYWYHNKLAQPKFLFNHTNQEILTLVFTFSFTLVFKPGGAYKLRKYTAGSIRARKKNEIDFPMVFIKFEKQSWQRWKK